MMKKAPKFVFFSPAQMMQTPVREWPRYSTPGEGVVKFELETVKRSKSRSKDFYVGPRLMVRGWSAFHSEAYQKFGNCEGNFFLQAPFEGVNGPQDWNGMHINAIATYDDDLPEMVPDWLGDDVVESNSVIWDRSKGLKQLLVPSARRVAEFFRDAVEAFQTPEGTWSALRYDGFAYKSRFFLTFWEKMYIAAQCGVRVTDLHASLTDIAWQTYKVRRKQSLDMCPSPTITLGKYPLNCVKIYHDFAVEFCKQHALFSAMRCAR